MPAFPRALLPALVLLFFVSGGCGLVYQVLWLRLLSIVFGVTVHATSTVLASFMAGLALGSALGGRLADRARRPLLWFGAAEALVGLSALATPWALEAVESLYVRFQQAAPESLVWLTALRVVGSAAVLLVPTMMMGASLPLVVRSSLARHGNLGGRVGLLYGANTAGAIVGTLLAGYWLIGGYGIAASFRFAAALNLGVGLGAALLSRTTRTPDERSALLPEATSGEEPLPPSTAHLVLFVFAVSGFCSLALEVVWFRVLLLFVPTTTYAFTTMLATVLGGIAAGSATAASLLRRKRDWLAWLAMIEVGIAILCLVSFSLLAWTYTRGWRTSGLVQASVVAIGPAAFLLGMAYPVGLHLWARGSPGRLGGRIGLFGGWNLLGGIVGSLACGFWLLPRAGSRASLIALAALVLAGALLLLVALGPGRRPFALKTALAAVALFGGAAVTLPDPFAAPLARRYKGDRLLWREEGVQGTVSVHETATGERVLYIDGAHQAGDSSTMRGVHQLIGQLPLVLHPDPREVLVIGLAGGSTPGAASLFPGVEVDVVEISEAVVHGSLWFRHVNHDLLRRSNVHLRLDDGRNYLRRTSKRYDVVTADIVQPFHAGAGMLYSTEYFHLARRALGGDGLMLQWIGFPKETQWKLLVRTFLDAFPHATLWSESLLVGGVRPLRLDPAGFEAKRRDPETRAALDALGFTTFESLASRQTAGPEALRRFTGPGPILTDDRPLVEYYRSLPKDDPPIDLRGLR